MRKHILLTVLLAGIHIPYQETKSMSQPPEPIPLVEVKTYEATQSALSVPTPQHEYSYQLVNKIKPRGIQWTVASISAYSCRGIKNAAQRRMNCPNNKTASGTIPTSDKTAACGKALLGKTIEIEGVGIRRCEDRGGRITNRHVDLYVSSIQEAKKWGRKNLRYRVVDN